MRELKVYFGQDLLPYKDKEHQVHFPIVGNAFQGASQTDIIKFYIGDIALNDSAVWVACSKLPTGELGYNLLDTRGNDSDGSYVQLTLTRWHTQYQGNLYICLHCYAGGIELEEDEETHLLTPVGEPVIRVTGGIKMNIAYATGVVSGDEVQTHTLEELWAKFGEYLRLDDNHYLKVLNVITDINNELYKDYIENTDLVLAKPTIGDTNYSVYKISGTYPNFTYSMLGIQISALTVNTIVANQVNVPTFADIKRGDSKTLSTYIEEEIDEVAQTKVDKTSGANKVYGTNNNGEQTTINVDYGATFVGNVVRRNRDSQIYVPLTPIANGHAASKKYVDDKVAEFAQNEMQVVSELPTTGVEGIIYLLPIDPTDLTKGYYRYIWEEVGGTYQWLSLGTTEVDLSGYQEKLTAGRNISISSNNTIKVADDPSFDELRVDNGQYQLYVESPSNDMAGISYTSGNLASDIRIYQGVPEINNASSNYKLSFRVGTQDIDIISYDLVNETSTTVSLLATLNGKQNTLVSGTNIKTLNGVSLLGSGNIAYDNALNNSSTNAPQTKVVYEELQNVREIAEGKTQTFIVDATLTIATLKAYGSPFMFYVYNRDTKEWENKKTELLNGDYDSLTIINSSFNSQTVFNGASNQFIITGQPIGAGSAFYLLQLGSFYGTNLISRYPLKNGYIFYVLQTDVPDRWYGTSGFTFNILEAKTNLNNYVDLTSPQTITGNKSFKTGFDFVADNYDYDCSIYITPLDYDDATMVFSINHGDKSYYMSAGSFYADSNTDLGSNSNKWRDLYLSRNLTDGTYSAKISDLYAKTYGLFSDSTSYTENLDPYVIKIITISVNATIGFVAVAQTLLPEYKGIITNNGSSDITITFTDINTIKCNDDSLTISSNTITLPSGTTIEVNAFNGNLIAFNWSAQ